MSREFKLKLMLGNAVNWLRAVSVLTMEWNMKLVLSLLVLAGVMYTNDTFAGGRRSASCGDGGWQSSGWHSSGWTPVDHGGWSSCDSGWHVSSCCDDYGYQTYGQPYYVPQQSQAQYRSGSHRYVEIDGYLYLVRTPQVQQHSYEVPAATKQYAPAPAMVTESPRHASQQGELPTPKAKAPVQKSNGLLSNPTRGEAPRSRYEGVEFFDRSN